VSATYRGDTLTLMNRLKLVVLLGIVTAVFTFGLEDLANAGTLISVTGPDSRQDGLGVFSDAFAVSWTLSQSFSGVSILVPLGFGPQLGTAYLMNSLGPGTSQAANEVGSTMFNFPLGNTVEWVTLFAGLNLGPGTYYLMVGANDVGWAGGVWYGDPNGGNSVALAPGVSQGAEYILFPRVVQGPPIYPPSTQFVGPYPAGLEYMVVSVPESRVDGATALCLVALFVWVRARWSKSTLIN
jgi:hypothetical protein